MNKKAIWMGTGFILSLVTYVSLAFAPFASVVDKNIQSSKIGIVNFKSCLEKSKVGQKEQAGFEAVKKQMETSMDDKEKELNDLSQKFNEDYLATLKPEAVEDLKKKFRELSQSLNQQQNQYYQMLQQTNYQIIQKVTDMIAEASSKVSKQKGLDIILNEDACFFSIEALDISPDVVKELDTMFAKTDSKDGKK